MSAYSDTDLLYTSSQSQLSQLYYIAMTRALDNWKSGGSPGRWAQSQPTYCAAASAWVLNRNYYIAMTRALDNWKSGGSPGRWAQSQPTYCAAASAWVLNRMPQNAFFAKPGFGLALRPRSSL
jgi:hypothetical protein